MRWHFCKVLRSNLSTRKKIHTLCRGICDMDLMCTGIQTSETDEGQQICNIISNAKPPGFTGTDQQNVHTASNNHVQVGRP